MRPGVTGVPDRPLKGLGLRALDGATHSGRLALDRLRGGSDLTLELAKFGGELELDLGLEGGETLIGVLEGPIEPIGEDADSLVGESGLRFGLPHDVVEVLPAAVCGCVGGLVHALGQLLLGSGGEALHPLLELARKSLRALLARLLDLRVEPTLGLLGEPSDSPLEAPLELLELAVVDLGELDGESRPNFRLLPLGLVSQRALERLQALADGMQRAAAFRGVRLDLCLSGLGCGRHGVLELGAELRQGAALLLGNRSDLRGVGGKPVLVSCKSIGLAANELLEVPLQRVLATLEVSAPGGETTFETRLDGGHGVGELRPRFSGLSLHRGTAFLGKLAFLRRKEVVGLGALSRERSLELERAQGRVRRELRIE